MRGSLRKSPALLLYCLARPCLGPLRCLAGELSLARTSFLALCFVRCLPPGPPGRTGPVDSQTARIGRCCGEGITRRWVLLGDPFFVPLFPPLFFDGVGVLTGTVWSISGSVASSCACILMPISSLPPCLRYTVRAFGRVMGAGDRAFLGSSFRPARHGATR